MKYYNTFCEIAMTLPYHQQVLIDAVQLTLDRTNVSAAELAETSGVNGSSLSRFMNGKQDLKAGDYFALLNALPDFARKAATTRLGIEDSTDLIALIRAASPKEKAAVLNLMADWIESRGSTETKLMPEAV